VAIAKGRGGELDPIVRELALLTLLACVGLGLAWAYEADLFAMFFAVAAAFAGVEAVRRAKRFRGPADDTASPLCSSHSLIGDQRDNVPILVPRISCEQKQFLQELGTCFGRRSKSDGPDQLGKGLTVLFAVGGALQLQMPLRSLLLTLDQLQFARALQLPPNFDPRPQDIRRLLSIAIRLKTRRRRGLMYSDLSSDFLR
jgi:hypothetical protein